MIKSASSVATNQNVMRCKEGFAWCEDRNFDSSAAWTFVYPQNTEIMKSVDLAFISVAATAAGAVIAPLACLTIGLTAYSLVHVAMKTFGVVVPGVWTMHASLGAGGCAAFLQTTSATLLTTKAAVAGAAVGATTGAAIGIGSVLSITKEGNSTESEKEHEKKQ
jgi:hypothetical protein